MIRRSLTTGALALALVAGAVGSAEAQLPEHMRDYPLTELKPQGDIIAPFFDGWYDNGDGTITYSFGFLNRNTEEIVDIPLGENNSIEPAEFDGVQPTHFPVYDRGGLQGKRERGAFAVTLPAHMKGTEVTWTLSHAGETWSVPGRSTSPAYELSRAPAAFGSLPPAVRFDHDGPEVQGTEGIVGERVRTTVGTPVTLSALVQDRGERAKYDLDAPFVPVRAVFIEHQGPGDVTFEPREVMVDNEGTPPIGEGRAPAGLEWGTAETRATFSEPGEYLVRIRVDNFEAPDSRFDNVCCWTNAYVPVTVTK